MAAVGAVFDLVLPLRKLKQSERPQKQRSFYCSYETLAFSILLSSISISQHYINPSTAVI